VLRDKRIGREQDAAARAGNAEPSRDNVEVIWLASSKQRAIGVM